MNRKRQLEFVFIIGAGTTLAVTACSSDKSASARNTTSSTATDSGSDEDTALTSDDTSQPTSGDDNTTMMGDGDDSGMTGDGDDSGTSTGDTATGGDGDVNTGGDGDGDSDTTATSAGGDGDGDGDTSELVYRIRASGLLDGASAGWEQARDVAFDAEGNVYVVGGTTSTSGFPTTAGAYDTTFNTGGTSCLGSQPTTDAFIVKLNPSGQIIWSTFLGGGCYDRAYAVEVDADGAVYVAGRAGDGFPTTAGAHQETFAGDGRDQGVYGDQDGFVAKLSEDGSTLIWSTYFGEDQSAFIRDIDIDDAGRVHIAATAVSGDMSAHLTGDAAQSTRRGDFDSFYARLAADGSKVEYGTYLGGNDSTGYYSGNPSVRTIGDGTAYVLAYDPGPGAPTTANAFQKDSAGAEDFLIARFSVQGGMDWCSYLGGDGVDAMDTHTLALDSAGNPVLAGFTNSTNFPTTDQSKPKGAEDGVIAKLSSDGTKLLASTVFGGNGVDAVEGLWVDSNDDIHFSGESRSSDIPVTSGALVKQYVGERSGLMGVLSADFSAWRYLSYDGIKGEYANRSTAVGPDGTWAIVGSTWNMTPFPSTAGQDNQIDGTHAAFFTILELE